MLYWREFPLRQPYGRSAEHVAIVVQRLVIWVFAGSSVGLAVTAKGTSALGEVSKHVGIDWTGEVVFAGVVPRPAAGAHVDALDLVGVATPPLFWDNGVLRRKILILKALRKLLERLGTLFAGGAYGILDCVYNRSNKARYISPISQ